jgi:hypothetical protein
MEDAAIFVIVMTAMVLSAWLLHSLIRTWQTSRLTPAAGDKLEATRETRLLADENAELRSCVGRLEERIAVLERIATDPAHRTAREIEELR